MHDVDRCQPIWQMILQTLLTPTRQHFVKSNLILVCTVCQRLSIWTFTSSVTNCFKLCRSRSDSSPKSSPIWVRTACTTLSVQTFTQCHWPLKGVLQAMRTPIRQLSKEQADLGLDCLYKTVWQNIYSVSLTVTKWITNLLTPIRQPFPSAARYGSTLFVQGCPSKLLPIVTNC